MSKKKKRRKLWTKITGQVPPGTGAAEFWGTLRNRIREGDYDLPDDWNVTIEWKNKEDAEYKSDDFSSAMIESAESSRGWDMAILNYVNKQIDKLPAPGAVPAKLAARSRRLSKAKRSAAAKKGWKTRKAAFKRRSLAAKKGWITRRRRARKPKRKRG